MSKTHAHAVFVYTARHTTHDALDETLDGYKDLLY